MKRIYSTIFLLYLLFACSTDNISNFDFFIGTWKVEGKEQFEVWNKNKHNELIGYSYNLVDNQKIITETLSIIISDNQIIYEATVPNQNEGKTVQFILNSEIDSCFSFENENHDFPKKIQYQRISDDNIKITVLGENDKGFSFIQFKRH